MPKKLPMKTMSLNEVSAELGPIAQEVPSYTGLNKPVLLAPPTDKFLTREEFVQAIRELWDRAQQQFIATGRYLIAAKDKLAHGEFMAMVTSDLPFSPNTANKLMRVARAVDKSVLPADKLPRSYATVYEVLTLSDTEREQAVAEGVLHPQALLRDIKLFKGRVRARESTLTEKIVALELERARLLARIAEIDANLEELRN
jgi:hypothetical protein